jgi:hypothetical protein
MSIIIRRRYLEKRRKFGENLDAVLTKEIRKKVTFLGIT